jgi:hypothetical protein
MRHLPKKGSEVTRPEPNQLPALDAAMRISLHIELHCRRASEAERWAAPL